jgi:hypothetical protein
VGVPSKLNAENKIKEETFTTTKNLSVCGKNIYLIEETKKSEP